MFRPLVDGQVIQVEGRNWQSDESAPAHSREEEHGGSCLVTEKCQVTLKGGVSEQLIDLIRGDKCILLLDLGLAGQVQRVDPADEERAKLAWVCDIQCKIRMQANPPEKIPFQARIYRIIPPLLALIMVKGKTAPLTAELTAQRGECRFKIAYDQFEGGSMSTEISTQPEVRKVVVARGGGSDAVYGLGLIGAWMYYFRRATTNEQRIMGFLKGLVWPVFMVYELFKFLEKQQSAS